MDRDPLTLEAFAEWCETKPAGRAYDYGDPCNCACAQYAESIDVPYIVADAVEHGSFWEKAEYHAVNCEDPDRTFGALAKRLREAA